MRILEVEIGKDLTSKRNAIGNFEGKEVIIKDFHRSWIHGKIKELSEESYIFSSKGYSGDYRTRDKGSNLCLDYLELEQLLIINPKTADTIRARENYHEITQKTIAETTKWARRGYQA